MKKEKIIEMLSSLPANSEVCIVDLNKNFKKADSEGSMEGIISDFEIQYFNNEDIDSASFIGLVFDQPLKPNSDYDFEEGDIVSIETNEGTEYALLTYDDEGGVWMLVYFSDDTFQNIKTDEKGIAEADFLFEIGIDSLEKVDKDDLNQECGDDCTCHHE